MMSVLDCRWWFAGIIGELNCGVGLAMLMLLLVVDKKVPLSVVYSVPLFVVNGGA